MAMHVTNDSKSQLLIMKNENNKWQLKNVIRLYFQVPIDLILNGKMNDIHFRDLWNILKNFHISLLPFITS